jgi:DNA-binding NarL/FixJ family response regulator
MMTPDFHGPADGLSRPRIRIAVADARHLIAPALGALVDTINRLELLAAFDLVRSLRRIALSLQIVVIADALTPELVRVVLDHSLNGLILTDSSPADLVACLDRVACGDAVLPANWQCVLASGCDDPIDTLSERQLEVLTLVAEGCSYEEIGARLFISANTVKFHLRSIYLRLGVRNRHGGGPYADRARWRRDDSPATRSNLTLLRRARATRTVARGANIPALPSTRTTRTGGPGPHLKLLHHRASIPTVFRGTLGS